MVVFFAESYTKPKEVPVTGNMKIILEYDKSSFEEKDRALLLALNEYIQVVKVGLEAMTAEHPKSRRTIAGLVAEFCIDILDIEAMWDMKLGDIGNTVAQAVHNIGKLGASLFTLHASASDPALAAAVKVSKKYNMTALVVTVPTDLDDNQCRTRFLPRGVAYGGNLVEALVLNYAENAYGLGIRSFVCSAQEARIIRRLYPNATIVTPAIRPLWSVASDEQQRVTTPTQAAEAGADYIVVGHPILRPPRRMKPIEAAKRIREELDAVS
ncbi:MAG: orotidine-5'-phosphate decarboxylase [Patescibacteria group bacterium]|nr:orotidine-5'-phosphate decarboxylase [Patescibacteria group bacterium]